MGTATANQDQAVVSVCQQSPPPRLYEVGNRSSVTLTDILVFALILVLGASAFLFYRRSLDFIGEDVFYADAARSLIEHGFYGIDGRPETNQPPGLPAILATLFVAFGYSNAICLHAMAVLEALGFLAAYELLRRHLPKLVAAAICVVLMSSPIYFQAATQSVFPGLPAFFTTVVALLAFEEYQNASSRARQLIWGLALSSTIVASLMIASGAIALLGGMVAVIGITSFRDRRLAFIRLQRLLPVLLVGIVVQGLWMHRKPAPPEWSLPGYPAPYLQQLKVKSGNYPELGMATLGDIPTRIRANLADQSDLLTQLLLRHGVNPSKVWIIIVPILVIAIGWTYSVWQTGGGLLEWYFAGYEFIYLMWPWRIEHRFFLPVAPLACFYAWKGIKAIYLLAMTKPRAVGAAGFPLGLLLGISGWHWIFTEVPTQGFGCFPDELMAPIWCGLAVCAAGMAYTGRPPSFLISNSRTVRWITRLLGLWRVSPLRFAQCAVGVVIVMLVGLGLAMQVGIARENVRFPYLTAATDTSRNAMALDVESGEWIRSHTPITSVVMARHLPLVYHYAQRKLVWFAPISNPDALMEGIVRLNVDYVIVIKHKYPYYLPDDDYCFDRLLREHGDSFSLVFRDSNLRIFQLQKNSDRLSRQERQQHALGTTARPINWN